MDHEDGFHATELTLCLPGTTVPSRCNKRPADDCNMSTEHSNTKVQVVGWPPVRSFRRNFRLQKSDQTEESESGMYVKVSMVGAPYLRKMDLKTYKGYKDLRVALEYMFDSFSVEEHVITYEDKDGDWMMVGDVPFEMFISSCKRLKIMKGSEARGLGSSP